MLRRRPYDRRRPSRQSPGGRAASTAADSVSERSVRVSASAAQCSAVQCGRRSAVGSRQAASSKQQARQVNGRAANSERLCGNEWARLLGSRRAQQVTPAGRPAGWRQKELRRRPAGSAGGRPGQLAATKMPQINFWTLPFRPSAGRPKCLRQPSSAGPPARGQGRAGRAASGRAGARSQRLLTQTKEFSARNPSVLT